MFYRIKKFFRQMFCDHLWKIEEEVPMYESFKHIDDYVLETSRMVHVALYYKCLKCGKKRIRKTMRPKGEMKK